MSKEAMKLALEALEPLVRRAAPWGEQDWLNGCKAITALREALVEQPAKQDIPDLIAGTLGVSRGTAYDLMREALAEQPAQQKPLADDLEAWKTSDTAYRPEGLPQDFIKHEVDSFDDWSEWVCPDPTQYFMKCCDCGLVHEMQFNVVKYSAGDNCEDVDDPYVQAVFRARRVTPPAAQRQWVGLMDEEENALIPEPDGSAEANVKRVEVLPGAWGKEYDVVDAWSKPLVLQMLRDHEAKLREKNA